MEAAVIVEGFNRSVEFYNLKYEKFIGDGDSSVFSEIRKKVTYGLEVSTDISKIKSLKISDTNIQTFLRCKKLSAQIIR